MHPQAIIKAKSRLRVARRAIEELRECTDFATFTDTWYTFLVAAKNVYTALEKGSKASPQSMQWFGARKQERKDDELLQYMFQARDDDEHGLGNVAEPVPASTCYGVYRPGQSRDITFSMANGVITRLQANDGLPIAIEHRPARIELRRVHGRNRQYDPPKSHKGQPIDGSNPYLCGLATVAHLDELVRSAEGLA